MNSEAYNTTYRELDLVAGYEPKRVERYDSHVVAWIFYRYENNLK